MTMKLGFIGNHPLMEQLGSPHHGDIEVSGMYEPGSGANGTDVGVYTTAEPLVLASDVLFVSHLAASPFDICKLAVKESRHLFFETPFILGQEQLEVLYDLARESQSIIRLNQGLLHHPLFLQLMGELDPGMVIFRVDSASQYFSHASLEYLMFEVASLLRGCISSGLRKAYSHVVPFSPPRDIPSVCQVRLDFDNGASAMVLVNHLTSAESFGVEFFQDTGRYSLDLKQGTAWIYSPAGNNSHRLEKDVPDPAAMTHEDLAGFLQTLSLGRVPLTIREKGEAVYQLARYMIEHLFSKMQLLA